MQKMIMSKIWYNNIIFKKKIREARLTPGKTKVVEVGHRTG